MERKYQVLNVTRAIASTEQLQAGVVEPKEEDKADIIRLQTFNNPPNQVQIQQSCNAIANIVADYEGVGVALVEAPSYMQATLVKTLAEKNIKPVGWFRDAFVLDPLFTFFNQQKEEKTETTIQTKAAATNNN